MSVLKYKGQDLMGIDRDWYDNLIPYPYYHGSQTMSGVTFTIQKDGTIKTSGTATADIYFNCAMRGSTTSGLFVEKGKHYTLSGCPSGGSNTKYYIGLTYNRTDGAIWSANDYGNGLGVDVWDDYLMDSVSIFITIKSGQNANGLVFKPMLERGGLKHTFKPPMDSSSNKVNKSDLLNLIYPVGSLYMSVNNTSPQTLFGGTWQQIKDRFLLSAGDTYTAGSTGGSATHTPSGTVGNHTLTIAEMPSHTHTFSAVNVQVASESQLGNQPPQLCNDHVPNWYSNPSNATGGGSAHNHPFTGTAQNTMPPYLTVYVWKRTA